MKKVGSDTRYQQGSQACVTAGIELWLKRVRKGAKLAVVALSWLWLACNPSALKVQTETASSNPHCKYAGTH